MKESVNGTRSHVTTDGIIRNPQVTQATLDAEVWDGRRNSYIPSFPLRIDHRLQLHQEADPTVDPITYQVLRSRLWQKNLEHGDVLQRVSGSVPVVYSRDYATGLLTETGDIVVTSPTIQFFSGLSDLIVMWTLENRSAEPGIEDGDVFLQNDPYIAAPQQSDTAVYAPIFWDGKLFCWVLNVMHVGDLGGVDPGGWAINARDIFDEGIVVPPIRIGTRGQVQWELIQMFARQSREPDFVILNAKSALAGIASTRRQIEEMLDEFGAAAVKGVMRRMIANCSKTFSARLMEIPDGTWSERLYVTGAMPGERTTHHEILSITKRGDQVICSNRGTSPQGGAGNSTYAFLRSSIVAALSTALAFDQLGCAAGVANHVVLEPEAGTRNVARHPAAASAHLSTFVTVNLAALVTSKMMLSAPQDLRARAHASGGLAMPLADVIFGIGQDGRMIGNPASCAQALLGGCIGAFPFRDGVDSGAITAEEAQAAPIRTIQSGPVSGTMGSAFLAERMGEPNLIVTDMGGTSFDVSVIRNGSPELRETSFVERFEIALPMVHVDSIGAGGGSIAWIDDAGGLQVGPQSAGADPGPACYGKGGAEPTVTDADVVLGIIDPVNFLHGRLKLDLAAAESAIGRIAGRLHLDVYRAAAGINRIVDNKMADLLRRMSVMRGLDPRQFVCFAYGGMGPVHSTAIARDVGVKRLIVPMLHAASVWSAFGATVSDVVHVYERWQRIPMPADTLQLDAVFEELESKGRETLLKEGYPRKRVAVQRSLRMKYAVQVFDLEVPVGNDLTKATSECSRIYAERNGEVAGHPEGGVEITGFVVRVRGVREPLNMAIVPRAPSNWSSRRVYWEEFKEFVETPILILNAGPVDERLKGPCLIQLPDTVVALRPGQSAQFDEFGSLIIDL